MTDKELLQACRIYISNAHYISQNEYEDVESDMFEDPRVYEVMLETANILALIDDALKTRH